MHDQNRSSILILNYVYAPCSHFWKMLVDSWITIILKLNVVPYWLCWELCVHRSKFQYAKSIRYSTSNSLWPSLSKRTGFGVLPVQSNFFRSRNSHIFSPLFMHRRCQFLSVMTTAVLDSAEKRRKGKNFVATIVFHAQMGRFQCRKVGEIKGNVVIF